MRVTATSFRAAIRALNASGRALEGAGIRLVSLGDRSLLDSARRETGLADFGDETFREPLRFVLRALESEARLTLLGRVAARRDIVSLLGNRLRLHADRSRHPAIAEEVIRRPLFIVGLPRSGSTLLHHLMAQDPASRVAQAWEVMYPSPPPARPCYETDPRVARAEKQLRWLDVLAPDFKTIHPLGARLALECIAIMSHTFLSPRFHTTYRVPSYQAWLEGQDFRPVYDFHRRFLQHLQWRTPGERWVLKAPSHLFGFEALFASYPDALVVQTHRDPLTVLASVASLTAVLQGAFTDHLDLGEIGLEVTRRWAKGLERAMHARRRYPGDRFVDVRYADLVKDPMAVVRRIYAHFDLALTDQARARMELFLAENPKDRYGTHRYSLESFGLDAEDLAPRFKAYREHFGVEPEAAPSR